MRYRKSILVLIPAILCTTMGFAFINREPEQNLQEQSVPPPAIVYVEKRVQNKAYSEKEIQCMTDMVYHESRGEGIKGQIAVTHVTLNRMESPDFPKNACDVIYQRKGKVCQYSWVCGKYNNVAIRKTEEYKEIKLLVKTVIAIPDRSEVDPTKGALYFKRYDAKDKWFRNLVITARVGNHVFYA